LAPLAVRIRGRAAIASLPRCLWKFDRAFVPEGHHENSPTFQRWEQDRRRISPEGTVEFNQRFSRPFGTKPLPRPNPTLKGWAIVACPSGTTLLCEIGICERHCRLARIFPLPVAYIHSRYMRMKTAVQRWGNSLAVRIPRAFAQETRLGSATEVDLQVLIAT